MNKEASDFLNSVKKYKKIMIIIQGSPDPDAIAASFAIKELLKNLSINSEIYASKKVSLSQNRAFIKFLDIHLKTVKELQPENFEAYIVTDFQSNEVRGISEKIPCAAHIDHHQKDPKRLPSDFSLIKTESGSTSTLVTLILKSIEVKLSENQCRAVSTALMFGIQTDTDSYEHAGDLDIEALGFLSSRADMNIINRLNGIPMSGPTLSFYNRALKHGKTYKEWGFYGIGFIDIEQRDSLAIAADLLLKKSGLKTIAVYSIVNDNRKHEMFLDVSIRTKSNNLDLNSLIKKITPTGGGRVYKGAYQIKLDYFRNTADRDALWKTVETATLDWLKKSRDNAYLHELTGITKNIFRKAVSYLKNK
ncbi:MAG TPA: DHH family phosphoesterase [Spirochaetota bacterium]|nr:DHH family phosphoesterase [Spirochaetota bacterium]HPJ42458.1 DHH family phosphoesterase [Spirochaetota bacterium]HRX46416.1 DHH family phosphoesterase [Spirochaetota bacterium]